MVYIVYITFGVMRNIPWELFCSINISMLELSGDSDSLYDTNWDKFSWFNIVYAQSADDVMVPGSQSSPEYPGSHNQKHVFCGSPDGY